MCLAARLTDLVLQNGPHCHAPIHPIIPLPHPPLPLPIVTGCFTVFIGKLPAARISDITIPCVLPACIPAGPGVIALGGFKTLIGKMPAARLGDMTVHPSCVAPIPGPVGTVLGPCCPTVIIGS